MRFTWIALPVLLVTLTGTSGASPPPADESSERERVVERAPTSTTASVAALPSASVFQWKRLGAEQDRRDPHSDAAAPPGSRRANQARVRFRTVDLAGTAFIPEITRATTGFLSSSTTACPPPASR